MNLERLRTTVFLLLLWGLAGLTAVLGTRAASLLREPDELQGIDERKFLGFAWREPGLPETFARVKSAIPEGEEVWLTIPPDSDPLWWGLMARYYLPDQRVAGVLRRGERHPPPRGAWVVAVSSEGEAVVRRTRRPR